MFPASISAGLPQALNILKHLPAQVILDAHLRQRGGQIEHLLVGQLGDFARRVDVEPRHEPRRGVGADAEEVL